MLRDADAVPDQADVAGMNDETLHAFIDEWNRVGRLSPDWMRLPARSEAAGSPR